MPNINLYDAYNSRGSSIRDLFDRHEEGFCVPRYQREYTWGEERINQFFDDLVLGIRELVEPHGDSATTFLGTVILTQMIDESEPVSSGQGDAQPRTVQFVVDGHQRISTIALLAIRLSSYIKDLSSKLPAALPYSLLTGHCEDYLEKLEKLYSMRLGRNSKPPLKPKIIHARTNDQWTFGGTDSSYQSPVAHYIAKYIRGTSLDNCDNAISQKIGTTVLSNVKLMDRWIEGICSTRSIDSKKYEQFPVGESIITPRVHRYVLGYRNVNFALATLIEKAESNHDSKDRDATALYQLFLFCYYMVHRCGMNRLQPRHEEWGFDVLQTLNASGTSLTAMETFLPQVMQSENGGNRTNWDGTPSFESMSIIDTLFESTTTSQDKHGRVNELLTAFSLCYEGKKLPSRFNAQRSWLNQSYSRDLKDLNDQRRFVQSMAEIARFYREAWYMEDRPVIDCIRTLANHSDGKLCSLLVQYLRQACARSVAPILARYFGQFTDHERHVDEFTDAIKACAAFFTIWRSSHSSYGLDDIFRRFFQGSESPVKVADHTLQRHLDPILAADVKVYFSDILEKEGLDTCEAWIEKSEQYLLYSEVETVCRFVLFVGGHNRVSDINCPGLTKPGGRDVCDLLNLGAWWSDTFRSIEHIAPHSPPDVHDWDPEIYSNNRFEQVGNLLLFPADINNQVGTRGWKEKYYHYRYVGQGSAENADHIRVAACASGIKICSSVARRLVRSRCNRTVEPITLIGAEGNWDAKMIDQRTNQLKQIAWNRLASWLEL